MRRGCLTLSSRAKPVERGTHVILSEAKDSPRESSAESKNPFLAEASTAVSRNSLHEEFAARFRSHRMTSPMPTQEWGVYRGPDNNP